MSHSFPNTSVFSQTWLHPSSEPDLIVVADDDHTIRVLVQKMMEAEGYRVLTAQNGQECLQLCIEHQPDLVLVDAQMPVLDGFACCWQLTHRTDAPPIPVLLLTGFDDPASIERAFEAGATDFITKPIHWSLLCHRVERAIEANRAMVALQRQTTEMQQFNNTLEQYVEERTLELRERTVQLQQALEFAATLKRITDKVRYSLDEDQILQTAVQELAWALDLGCCNASLYDLEQNVSTIQQEYSASIAGYLGRSIRMDTRPQIYQQLRQRQAFQFCSQIPHPVRGRVSMFCCPIANNDGVLGDLWLISPEDRIFTEQEMGLVKQVAAQCAIGIRQARLYQASQAHVHELERLNKLKDDFLSTVSHELRSPLSNMRIAIQMLQRVMGQDLRNCLAIAGPNVNCSKSLTYLKILQNECEEEISLINDLLDLQRLDAGHHTLSLDTINLCNWIPEIVAGFEERAQERHLTIDLEMPPNPPLFVSDLAGMRRILRELLTNACKYTPPNELVMVKVAIDADLLTLEVTNSGVEIPASEQARVFDNFYRIPNGDPWKQGGTGLGLALVRRLVNHLGGSIQLFSGSRETRFTVTIPSWATTETAPETATRSTQI